jgi:hypothetical protein
MSFLFAMSCNVRRSGLVNGGWAFHRKQRTLVVALSDGAGTFLAISDYGSAEASVPLPTPPRPSLIAVPQACSLHQAHFSFCETLPACFMSAGEFLPSRGEVTIDWYGKHPRIKARFVAGLDISMSRMAPPARWTISGNRVPWRGEMNPKQGETAQ